MVELVDIYPTISEMLGLELPHKMAGVSLQPQLNDVTVRGKQAAISQVRHAKGFSIRTPKYRYTEWQDDNKSMELYDHDNDPMEHTNIVSNSDQELAIKKLKEELHSTINK